MLHFKVKLLKKANKKIIKTNSGEKYVSLPTFSLSESWYFFSNRS